MTNKFLTASPVHHVQHQPYLRISRPTRPKTRSLRVNFEEGSQQSQLHQQGLLERAMGIEPMSEAWERARCFRAHIMSRSEARSALYLRRPATRSSATNFRSLVETSQLCATVPKSTGRLSRRGLIDRRSVKALF